MKAAHRRTHRQVWRVLALVLPVIVLAAVALNLARPQTPAPVRLEAPAIGASR